MTAAALPPLRGNRMSGGLRPCRCGAATYRPRGYGRRMARRCDDCNLIVGRCRCRVSLTVHLCPPGDSALMPCCGISPHERMADRMTLDPRRVTCRGVA